LLSQPKVLLMDEPLSALDRRTKGEILPFIEKLRDHFALPIFYVTHDMTEVERLADQMVLLDKGRVVLACAALLASLAAPAHAQNKSSWSTSGIAPTLTPELQKGAGLVQDHPTADEGGRAGAV
jgi:molybdate transport system ATP-binding protein